jgi:hypothetical protein
MYPSTAIAFASQIPAAALPPDVVVRCFMWPSFAFGVYSTSDRRQNTAPFEIATLGILLVSILKTTRPRSSLEPLLWVVQHDQVQFMVAGEMHCGRHNQLNLHAAPRITRESIGSQRSSKLSGSQGIFYWSFFYPSLVVLIVGIPRSKGIQFFHTEMVTAGTAARKWERKYANQIRDF